MTTENLVGKEPPGAPGSQARKEKMVLPVRLEITAVWALADRPGRVVKRGQTVRLAARDPRDHQG